MFDRDTFEPWVISRETGERIAMTYEEFCKLLLEQMNKDD